jgi:uncharacterized protein
MNQDHSKHIATELGLADSQIDAVGRMLAEGATIPFMARYRKEATGGLDEVILTSIRDHIKRLEALDQRREAILKSLEQNGNLTPELHEAIMAAPTMAVMEDLYLPFRPRRRTRATIAREKDLEPLAEALFAQKGENPIVLAATFVNPEKGVAGYEDALAGARDIIAEWVSEDAAARSRLRQLFHDKGILQSTVAAGQEAAGVKYRDYFDWREAAKDAPSHRVLAMRRGESQDILNLTLAPPFDDAIDILEGLFVKGAQADSDQVRLAIIDGYKRLLSRAMETEMRLLLKERADHEAIKVFTENLRQLLLAPPLGAKRVMAIDPGFRTGCKIVCLDRQGKLLDKQTIYPHTSAAKRNSAVALVQQLCERIQIEAIAIGNGTAGRETEQFVRDLNIAHVPVVMVNESGASIYSASKIARQEFPDLDLTFRGAVSIGRRLMDPLAELVKIDPKSIGVGQYQHDVDQTALKQGLDDVVISCVNKVGVDVNRASPQLLAYVSGLGPQLAKNIVTRRDAEGPFRSREALKKVPRLGPKAFEQSAGFLRIIDGVNPLDASAVHPESYHIVTAMAGDLNCTVAELLQNAALQKKIEIERYQSDQTGLPTLKDILAELAKPGRDPRESFRPFAFAEGVQAIEDLRSGMQLPGIVTNVTAFGAFVDIGVHQDGLVHISELADKYVKDPSQIVKVQQQVTVTVLAVDRERKRIGLSMKRSPEKETSTKHGPGNKKAVKNKTAKASAKREPRPFNNPFAELLGPGKY